MPAQGTEHQGHAHACALDTEHQGHAHACAQNKWQGELRKGRREAEREVEAGHAACLRTEKNTRGSLPAGEATQWWEGRERECAGRKGRGRRRGVEGDARQLLDTSDRRTEGVTGEEGRGISPALSSFSSMGTSREAGPRVQTILVLAMRAAPP